MTDLDGSLLFGVTSAVLGSCAFLLYINDMLRSGARPLRSTWLIWSVLSCMAFFSNVNEGATDSLLFLGVQTGFTTLIFLLSLTFGMGSLFRRGDAHVLALAAMGIALWWMTDNALFALAISIAVSALGGAVTLIKTYFAPGTESTRCWMLSALSSAFGLLAVGGWDPVLMAYPAYLLTLYGGIVLAIVLGQRRLAREEQEDSVPLLLCPNQRTDLPPRAPRLPRLI